MKANNFSPDSPKKSDSHAKLISAAKVVDVDSDHPAEDAMCFLFADGN